MQNLDDYLCLDDIVCYDADGKPFEQYPKLWVKKDLERDDKGNILRFTSYEGASYLEKQGLFLPSFALSCSILTELYKHRNQKEINAILMQYKHWWLEDWGFGYHAQNTVLSWGNNKMIHYPSNTDFHDSVENAQRRGWRTEPPDYTENINSKKRRKEYSFNPDVFNDIAEKHKYEECPDEPLEEVLKIPEFRKYIINLTGLQKPETLIEIGEYFGLTSCVCVRLNYPDALSEDLSEKNHTTSVYLGGDLIVPLALYIDDCLSARWAARGVRLENSKAEEIRE